MSDNPIKRPPLSYRLGELAGNVRRGFDTAAGFAESKKTRGPKQGEVGFTGLNAFAGIINEDYQVDLDNVHDRISAYDKMRSDGDCSAIETAVTLPLLGATWTVEPADADDTVMVEQAESIERNLMEGMTVGWHDVLRHTLRAVFYGFAFSEKVWEQRDGEFVWRKLAPRKPDTLKKWLFDEAGGLAGIQQYGPRITANGGQQYETVDIPIEKLMVATYRGEYGNPEGRGLYRDAYGHWYFKRALYTAAGIRIERSAAPTPMARAIADANGNYPQSMSAAQLKSFREALGRVRTNEQGAIILPNGYEVLPFADGSANVPFLDFIQHHGNMILRTAMAGFLSLGQDGAGGSRALSEDSSDFFIMSLKSTADWVCNLFNKYAIPQRVDYNWGAPKGGRYPKLVCSSIGVKDKAALAQTMTVLCGGGSLVDRKDSIGDLVRKTFDLPEMSDEEKQEESAEPKPPTPPVRIDTEGEEVAGASEETLAGEVAEFADVRLERQLDDAEDSFAVDGRQIAQDMISRYMSKLRPAVADGNIKAIQAAQVPLVGKYENYLKQYLNQVVALGKEAVARTTGETVQEKTPRIATQWVAAKAASLAEAHAATLKFVVTTTLIDDLGRGVSADSAMARAEGTMTETLSDNLDADLATASQQVVDRLQDDEVRT